MVKPQTSDIRVKYKYIKNDIWVTYKYIRKKEWLLVCTCNPNKNLISNHLKDIGKNLDNYSSKYDNFVLLSDLNSEHGDITLSRSNKSVFLVQNSTEIGKPLISSMPPEFE